MGCNEAAARETAAVIPDYLRRIRFWIVVTGSESPGDARTVGDARRAKRGCKSNADGPASLRRFGWDTHLERNKRSIIRLRTTRRRDLGRYLQSRKVAARVGGSKDEPPVEYKITTVYFPLVRNDASKPTWLHLLNQPVFDRRVVVSVGFSNGEEIRSELRPDAQGEQKLDQQFFLTIIPKFRTAFGFIVILIALIAFSALARYTHIIRDTNAPRRPDGKRPYSLARGQMAFWFFLVIASYFFLWVVTGDMNTLNSSVLALIGISAGTPLGSAFVDASKPVPVGSSGNQPIVDVTRPHLEVLAELKQLRADTQKELEALQKVRTAISPSEKEALDENERQQNEVRERLANYRWQSAYFAWPTWKGVMYDLLAENNLISFHRFQIFVWTLILGIMFVASVYNELAMPEFSATLLGLLGISAGTYVGFKLPEAKTQ